MDNKVILTITPQDSGQFVLDVTNGGPSSVAIFQTQDGLNGLKGRINSVLDNLAAFYPVPVPVTDSDKAQQTKTTNGAPPLPTVPRTAH